RVAADGDGRARQAPCDNPAMPPKTRSKALKRSAGFDVEAFLDSAGAHRRIVKYTDAAPIFVHGEPASAVMYIQSGNVKLAVLARNGKEAIVAVLERGDFVGEGCLAGQPRRMSSASAMGTATLLVIEKTEMLRLLHAHRPLADRFINHML